MHLETVRQVCLTFVTYNICADTSFTLLCRAPSWICSVRCKQTSEEAGGGQTSHEGVGVKGTGRERGGVEDNVTGIL